MFVDKHYLYLTPQGEARLRLQLCCLTLSPFTALLSQLLTHLPLCFPTAHYHAYTKHPAHSRLLLSLLSSKCNESRSYVIKLCSLFIKLLLHTYIRKVLLSLLLTLLLSTIHTLFSIHSKAIEYGIIVRLMT